MKKKILMFVLMLCLVVPCAFLFSACEITTNADGSVTINTDSDDIISSDGAVNSEGVPTTYTINFAVNNSEYGSVNVNTLEYPIGTAVVVDGNTITIGETAITATPATSNAQYAYAFDGWLNASELVVVDNTITITANFTRTVNEYTVTFEVNASYGSVDRSSVTVPYGTSIGVSGDTITIGDTVITASPNQNNIQYTFTFNKWMMYGESLSATYIINEAVVDRDLTITPTFTSDTREYTITILVNNSTYGSVNTNSISVPYGSRFGLQGANTLRIIYPNNTNVFILASASENNEIYEYAFVGWEGFEVGEQISTDRTITANFSCTANANFGYDLTDETTWLDYYNELYNHCVTCGDLKILGEGGIVSLYINGKYYADWYGGCIYEWCEYENGEYYVYSVSEHTNPSPYTLYEKIHINEEDDSPICKQLKERMGYVFYSGYEVDMDDAYNFYIEQDENEVRVNIRTWALMTLHVVNDKIIRISAKTDYEETDDEYLIFYDDQIMESIPPLPTDVEWEERDGEWYHS